MTREAKIGLLVGLAFLIVIGVLLSEHLVNATNPRPAPLIDAGQEALAALRFPGGANPAMATPLRPGNVVPDSPVLTTSDLFRQNSGPAVAEVHVGSQPPGPAIEITDMQATGNVNRTFTPVITTEDGATLVSVAPGAPSSQQIPEGFVPVATEAAPSATPIAAAVMEYRAQAGDSVSKMARRFLGSDSKVNRDLIINANAILRNNPNRIIVGRTYVIPVRQSAQPAGVASAPPAGSAGPALSAQAAAGAERIYVVKAGDNLWKIARDQCRSTAAIDEIRKLNRQVLKNGDNLQVGMKLRLPAK